MHSSNITAKLAKKIVALQFPEYAHLTVSEVEKQGHDNRTYRLGNDLLIRMPSASSYAMKVYMEHKILPQIAPLISTNIPMPIKLGAACSDYSYPFSIYKWLKGKSINLLKLDEYANKQLAYDLAKFLKEMQSIEGVDSLGAEFHSDRASHISIYDQDMHKQALKLRDIIDYKKAIDLWRVACKTSWKNPPTWVHGDFAIGNILMHDNKLSAVIDFGSMAKGDIACDLVLAWTYFTLSSRDIFINQMRCDHDTLLRARAWALWKATYELCQLTDKNSFQANIQRKIIDAVINE